MHGNILLIHEVMNKFNPMKGKNYGPALKLDMKKAYDRVEWKFLFEGFKQLGSHKNGSTGFRNVSPQFHIQLLLIMTLQTSSH